MKPGEILEFQEQEIKPAVFEEVLKVMTMQLDILKLMAQPSIFIPNGSGIDLGE